jgi:hypothetical protein
MSTINSVMQFLIALWVFSGPQGNALKFGLDLDDIIFHVPKNKKSSQG